jgi:hypothetical protein
LRGRCRAAWKARPGLVKPFALGEERRNLPMDDVVVRINFEHLSILDDSFPKFPLGPGFLRGREDVETIVGLFACK